MQVGENIIIKNLSGPVSYSILEPKIEKYADYDNLNPPIIMLFGDIHDGVGGECKNQDGYAIYSSNFLRALNSISTKEYPIDLNFEYFFNSEDLIAIQSNNVNKIRKIVQNNPTPFNKFLINNHSCFFKNLKNKTNCPAPNIKFHYVDIRIPSGNYDYEYEIIEFLSSGTFLKLANGKQIYNDKLNQIIKKIQMILNDVVNKTTTFIDYYFDNIDFTTRSLIYKQILKQTESLKRVSIWKKWFKEYYLYIITNISGYNTVKILDVFNTLISKLNKRGYTTLTNDIAQFIVNNKENFDDLINLIVNITSIFLDMYYITRAFKKPTNDTNSILSIGYFGHGHITNLTYLLTNIIKLYDKKYYDDLYANITQLADYNKKLGLNVDVDINYRCVNLPNFNLNDLIDKYKKLRITMYTLENIYEYTDLELDNFLSQNNDQNIYENISIKRYMTIYYLTNHNLFDNTQKNLIFSKSDTFYQLLENNVNSVNSLLLNLEE